ncbi:MAG: CBS domain-containing protein [SAR324 cluster bacterium]|nr:CBS domain-containing protein [SAR324 cluster bacterium]
MSRNVVTIDPEDYSGKALELLKKYKIHHLVVKNAEGKVVGMLSDKDLRTVINVLASSGERKTDAEGTDLSSLRVYNVRVRTIMNPNPVMIEAAASLQDAAKIMIENQFHCLPAHEGGILRGIVTHQDILKAVADGQLT